MTNRSAIDIFNFEGQRVRTAGTVESPLFCADDSCAVLGYSRTRDALRMLDQDEVEMVRTKCADSQIRLVPYVTEAGLYALIFGSKRPDAKAFKKWVRSDVLPTIRKTGSYSTDPLKVLADPAALRKLLGNYAERVEALEAEAAVSRPKAEVYDRIIDTGDTVGFREACKLIFAGTGAKEHEVREFFLRARWIQRLGGRLQPASYGQQNGYVTSRDRELLNVTNIDGGPMVVPELRITQRGVARAVERLNSERVA